LLCELDDDDFLEDVLEPGDVLTAVIVLPGAPLAQPPTLSGAAPSAAVLSSAAPAPVALPGAVPFSSLAPTPAFGGLFGSSTGRDAPALAFGEFGAAPGAAFVFGGFDASGAFTGAAAPAFGGFGAASLARMAPLFYSAVALLQKLFRLRFRLLRLPRLLLLLLRNSIQSLPATSQSKWRRLRLWPW